MFERYDEQARDRKLSVLITIFILVPCTLFAFRSSWWAGAVFAVLTVLFGVPPLVLGKDGYEKYLRVLEHIPSSAFWDSPTLR